jgi:excinuclease ABC subunit C
MLTIPEPLKRKLAELPDEPGCYLFRDARGTIIYVGKAISLRKRVQSYFRAATLRSADPKLRGLVRGVADLDILVLHNEAEAVLTEGRLIKEYRPRYNVDFKDDKRFLLIRCGIQDPFPTVHAVRLQREDGALYFGPYASSPSARAAVEFVQKRFGLRRCPYAEPGPDAHTHCINDIVRFCSAPCIGRITPADYRARVEEACAFLRGARPQFLEELRETMRDAATRQNYERAAILRDTVRLLEEATRRHMRVATTPALARATASAGLAQLQEALDLPTLPRIIEAFDVSNISGTLAVASRVVAVDGVPQPQRYRRFRIRTVAGSDDPAMMAEAIRRHYGRIQTEGGEWPDLLLVDGGLTQKLAAEQEVAQLGHPALPIIGLAKKREELHVGRDDTARILRLDDHSPALQLLRRLRDEAHRFALRYHQSLRRARIRESLLDEIPGVGARRKADLLRHFGSVSRLHHATLEEISQAPGIGPALAKEIHRVLFSKSTPG